MNIIYELYSLESSSINLSNKKNFNTDHGSVACIGDSMTIYHGAKSNTFNNQRFTVINAISNSEFTLVLCETNANVNNYKNFIYVYDSLEETIYSVLIPSVTNIFINNMTMMLKDKLYLIDDNSRCFIIDIFNKSSIASDINSVNYPAGNVYNAHIENVINLEKDYYCSKGIYSYSYIYFFSSSTNSIAKIDIEKQVSSKTYFREFVPIKSSDYIITCIEDNDDKDSSIVSCIVSGKSVIVVDMIDLTAYVSETLNKEASMFLVNNEIFIVSDKIIKVDINSLELNETFINEDISACNFSCINNKIICYSNSFSKAISNTPNTSTVNISCFDDAGEYISQIIQRLYPSNSTVTVERPIIDGYDAVGQLSQTINTNDDLIFVNFSYTISKLKSTLNIFHMCDKTIIAEETIIGVVGEPYKISPITIPGYYFHDSYNAENKFGASNNNVILYYTSETFHTDDNNNTFVCVKCISSNDVICTRYIPTTKGLNVQIKSPYLYGYLPVNSSYTVNSIVDDIHDVSIEYTPISDSIPVVFKVNDFTVYESTALVENEIATIVYPSFLKDSYSKIRVNGNKYLVINCSPKDFLTIVNILDSKKSNIIYTISKPNNTFEVAPLDIKNYEFIETVKTSNEYMTIHSMNYNKVDYIVKVNHTYNGEMLQSDTFTCKYEEVINIRPINDERYSTNSVLNYTITDDTVININYNYKITTVVAKIYDMCTNSYIETKMFRFNSNEEKKIRIDINDRYQVYYKDTDINTEVILKQLNSNIELLYIISVSDIDITPKYQIEYVDGYIKFLNKKISDRFMTVLHDNGTPINTRNKVYITKQTGKSNDSVKMILKSLTIPFEEIHVDNVNDIKSPCVLIDGNFVLSESFLTDYEAPDYITYLPMSINYVEFSQSLQRALYSMTITNVSANTSTIESIPYISNLSYNKITNNMYVDLSVDVTHYNVKAYELVMYDVRENKEVSRRTINVNTIHNFDRAAYVFNSSENTEPDISSLTDISNVKFNNQSKNDVVDTMLHCFMIDKLGNKTKTLHQPIIYNITSSTTANTSYKKIHSNNITRYNNRFRGPRESYKFHNTFKSCNNSVKELNELTNKIKNNYTYSDNKWVK